MPIEKIGEDLSSLMQEKTSRRAIIKGGIGAIGGLVLAGLGLSSSEVSAQQELPPHITYHEQAVSLYLEGSARVIRPLRPGDIWLAQAQKLRVLGVDFDINPEANPGRAIVFAIGAATHLDLDYSTVNGVFVWSGLESTPRRGGDFLRDIQTAGKVQVSRAQIPGNCTPEGCTDVRLVMAVGHRDADGVVRFDAIPDERFTK